MIVGEKYASIAHELTIVQHAFGQSLRCEQFGVVNSADVAPERAEPHQGWRVPQMR